MIITKNKTGLSNHFSDASLEIKIVFMQRMIVIGDDLGKLAFVWLSTKSNYVRKKLEEAFDGDWNSWFCSFYPPEK